jgi:hypothetical protein
MKKEQLDRQGPKLKPCSSHSHSPKHQQLIEGITLVLQLSLPVHYVTKSSIARQGDTSGQHSHNPRCFSEAAKTTAVALRYVIKRSLAALLSSKLD